MVAYGSDSALDSRNAGSNRDEGGVMDATDTLATDPEATLADALMLVCDSIDGLADAMWAALGAPGVTWRMVDYKESEDSE